MPDIPVSHYSLEPTLRDRGPAIGLATLIMHHDNPRSSFMTMWSDHDISEKKGYFKKLLLQADQYLNANPNTTITVWAKVGFTPTVMVVLGLAFKYWSACSNSFLK